MADDRDEIDPAQIRMDDLAFERRERLRELREQRVLTYTKVYRVTTKLSDEEIVEYATSSKLRDIDTLIDALDLIADLSARYGDEPDDRVSIEVHNTKVEERDPGLF